MIVEDEVKDNKHKGGREEDNKENAFKIDRLIMILQESIRILGQFIRKDKLVHVSTLKCHLEAKHECTSPANSKIQTQILLDLQKVCFSLLNFIEMHSSTISNLISFTKLLKLFFFFVLFAEREKIEEDNKEKKKHVEELQRGLRR